MSSPVDVDIDGATGEGGGQVVRVSTALAAVLSRSLVVRNIRASRSSPGLRAQHLAGVLAVARLRGIPAYGAQLGATSIRFDNGGEIAKPSENLPIRVEVQTAGACALVLQAALPVVLRCCASGPALILTGGTVGTGAPHADYVINVLSPNLRLFGVHLEYSVDRDGFFPRGGAIVRVSVSKSPKLVSEKAGRDGDGREIEETITLNSVDLTSRGDLVSIGGRAIVSGAVSDAVGQDMVMAAKKHMRHRLRNMEHFPDMPIVLERLTSEQSAGGDCGAITLWASLSGGTVLGASALLDRNTTGDGVGKHAADELCDALKTGACVDSFMADQLVVYVYMLRAPGCERLNVYMLTSCCFLYYWYLYATSFLLRIAGMARGRSQILVSQPSLHLTTVVDVLRQYEFSCRLEPVEDESGNWLLVCDGAGVSLQP
jgi:RNA 3'-terminal phosphate cyclase (ATP)